MRRPSSPKLRLASVVVTMMLAMGMTGCSDADRDIGIKEPAPDLQPLIASLGGSDAVVHCALDNNSERNIRRHWQRWIGLVDAKVPVRERAAEGAATMGFELVEQSPSDVDNRQDVNGLAFTAERSEVKPIRSVTIRTGDSIWASCTNAGRTELVAPSGRKVVLLESASEFPFG